MSTNDIHISLAARYTCSIPVSADISAEYLSIAQRTARPHLDLTNLNSNSTVKIAQSMHEMPVTSIKMSRSGCWIVTCSRDALVVWRRQNSLVTNDVYIPSPVVQNPGAVYYMTFSHDERWIALCAGTKVLAVHIETARQVMFEGHMAPISQCEFLIPHANAPAECCNWIVSVSDDRTFKSNVFLS